MKKGCKFATSNQLKHTTMKHEHPIGEKFKYGNETILVAREAQGIMDKGQFCRVTCSGCFFHYSVNITHDVIPPYFESRCRCNDPKCQANERQDGKFIVYKRIVIK